MLVDVDHLSSRNRQAQRSQKLPEIVTNHFLNPYVNVRPSLLRRIPAELIDRIIPILIFLPIIYFPISAVGMGYFIPFWIVVVFLWHLMRDCTPKGRSFGKTLFRLRTVSSTVEDQLSLGRKMMRRLGSAVSQVFYWLTMAMLFPSQTISQPAYKIVSFLLNPLLNDSQPIKYRSILMLSALAYDIASLTFILISSERRRIEDFFTRTQVIPQSAYAKKHKHCDGCKQPMPTESSNCPHCGEYNFVEKPLIVYMTRD
jgi:uncharacterized RDD family membrane protein YckC